MSTHPHKPVVPKKYEGKVSPDPTWWATLAVQYGPREVFVVEAAKQFTSRMAGMALSPFLKELG